VTKGGHLSLYAYKPELGISTVLPHAHPHQSKTIALLNPIDPSLSVILLLSRRVIDALASVPGLCAVNGTTEKDLPELRHGDDDARPCRRHALLFAY
jgi:hypothetical protein